MRIHLLLSCALGCTVSDLDLSRFACPCPADYRCVCEGGSDARCVPEDAGVVMCLGDAGTSDVAPACEGEFKVENLRFKWATQTVLAVEWDVTTREERLFGRYEFMLQGADETLTYDRDTNPELGEYDLDLSSTVVEQAWLRNLSPGVVYDTTLFAYDSSGGRCQVDAQFSTEMVDQINALELYEDEEVGNGIRWLAPQCAGPSTSDPFVGERNIRAEVACVDRGGEVSPFCVPGMEPPVRANSCFYNVVIGVPYLEIPSDLLLQFDEAFVEFTIRGQGEGLVSSDWSLSSLRTRRQEETLEACDRCPEEERSWRVDSFTVPINQGYQTFQVPLSEYRYIAPEGDPERGRRMEASDLETLELFLVGGTWPDRMFFDVDSVRIRW